MLLSLTFVVIQEFVSPCSCGCREAIPFRPTPIDNVERAQMDRDKSEAESRSLVSMRVSAECIFGADVATHALLRFPFFSVARLVEARHWRNSDEKELPPAHIGDRRGHL